MGKNKEIFRGNQRNIILRIIIVFFFLFQIGFTAIPRVRAATTLSLAKGSWDTIGLDDHDPAVDLISFLFRFA